MSTKSKIAVFLFAAVLLHCGRADLLAGGFRVPDQDAFATARGEAFAATVDNPSAVYYNPAGITQLQGYHLRGGIYGIDLDPSFTSPSSGRTFDNEDKLHVIPQVFSTYTPDALPVSFGLGLYSPFGLGLRWPQDTGFRTIGTQSQLTSMILNPVMAVKLAPTFSIGGGLMIEYAKADLRQGLFSPNLGTDGFRFVGDGWDVGYNLGALWQPHEQVFIGVTFRSGTEIDLKGHTDAFNNSAPLPIFSQRTVAQANFPFPLEAVFGISYRPTADWNLEFDAEYTDWNALGTVTIRQLPQNIPLVLDWQSSWYYEFGVTRYLGNGWQVSAGYIFNENSVPDVHYTPLVADLDRHFFSIGTGFKGKLIDFDVAYQLGYGPTRTVSGSAMSGTGQTANGDYEFISHAVLLTLGTHF